MRCLSVLTEDKEAARTLARVHWSSFGWTEPRERVPEDEFGRAVDAGYMFNALSLDHDDLVLRTRALAQALDLRDAVATWVSSLSTRRLFLRPALPSLVVARSLPQHSFDTRLNELRCAVCGGQPRVTIDRNVLNFERHKWGGVRNAELAFTWFCLDRLNAEGSASPTTADVGLLNDLWASLRSLPSGISLTNAEVAARGIPSSKAERHVLLEQLAVVDVLSHPGRPGFLRQFVDDADRELPPLRFLDRGYPGSWWTSDDRLSESALCDLFGNFNKSVVD